MTSTSGKIYWRSLDELQDTPEFREFLAREFPVAASEFPDGLSRRRWMQLMGASLALGGLAGCRWEAEKIAPFAVRPENRIPGQAEKFATSVEFGGMPRHLLVTCYDGRPVKVEGNPEHSDSRGATDSFAQATILSLYDPDRSDTLREQQGRSTFARSWDEFDSFVRAHLSDLELVEGEGLGILLEPTSSVSEKALLQRIRERFPKLRVFNYSPLVFAAHATPTKVLGRQPRTSLKLDEAQRIVCFDADILGIHPTSVRNIGGFARGRTPNERMNRMYVVESQHSVTGAAADHRLPMRSCEVPAFLGHIAALICERLGEDRLGSRRPELSGSETQFADAVVADLLDHQGKSVIVVGSAQPPAVHELALRLNQYLGNMGTTIDVVPDPLDVSAESLRDLETAAADGVIQTLFVLGGNPVYDAPGDVDFASTLASINTTIRCGQYEDETSSACTWHVPLAHPFEAWGDVRSWDGGICVSQPLIEPLLNGRSAIELLAQISADRREPQLIVRESIGNSTGRRLPTEQWQQLVHDGFVTHRASAVSELGQERMPVALQLPSPGDATGLEVVFTPSATALDGRFANNGWLQETPDFLTKLTWDNAAIIAPATAQALGLQHGRYVRIEANGHSVEVPVYVLPGQAPGSIGLALGYGRTRCGLVGGHEEHNVASVGVDVNGLRSLDQPFVTKATSVTPIDGMHEFATTQDHHAIDTVGMEEIGRRVNDLIRESPLDAYLQHPEFAQHGAHHVESDPLWKEPTYDGHAWGMSIDLNKCIGCNACTIACQAENNVPIVGKEQVASGREMHWLRIDRYFTGSVDQPEVTHQPVACHHCENAPCEQVCPVAATVHSDEGLNDMVYNRCVGTRYCANNCPYKVRRFNFFDYNQQLEESGRELVQLAVNPEVTVRSRGVMEKCTYCVQRIQAVKIDAKTSRRTIQDGEIKTACQQACPAQAIEFGDLNDSRSRVAQAHADPRAYGMLAELNVKPRTKYLAKIRNPNPCLSTQDSEQMSHHI